MSDSESVNYKETVNLPKTNFPMKANLPQKEPQMIEAWDKGNIYQRILDKNKGQPTFCMPDGPPYANGNIHLGHVLNKVLKDIVIKYKNLAGFSTAFIPGWDCHGLPIELKVTKALGKKKRDMTHTEIRELCRKEAHKWVETQKEQFRRLGIIADWENPYLTLQPEYEAEEVRVLADILENGILERGEKPVYWCPALQTALAAAEIEYHDHKSPSIYVKFPLSKSDKLGEFDKPVSFVIWTTTPWTLPANLAICLHPDLEYGIYDSGSEYLILAKELKENVAEVTELELKEIKIFKGSDFEGLQADHPFIDRKSQIILGHHVTLEAGTGCVHTAPGHGMDDYIVGLKYNLDILCPVDEAGRYNDDFPEMKGVKIWEANNLLVDKLVASGHMLHHSELTHSYPHNPRSKTPLIFRATPQWFIRMEDGNYNLRQRALTAAEKNINFIPAWGAQRLNAMISNSPDWCLSRQRLWGVPIPVFYCKSCGTELVKAEIMHKVADKMENSGKGIEAFYESDGTEFTEGHKCSNCQETSFNKGQDILDVWFDSGVCHTAVQKKRKELTFPADIYLEGSDQHRGWFQTSLMSSIAANGEVPFKTLITHGFVNDAKGHKMSKSKGNVIDPAKVIKNSGAEILRLWVAYEDYGQDVNISNEMFQRITETYRRIRNTMRFMLGNLGDFNPEKDLVHSKDMPILDQWALTELNQLIAKTTEFYDNYNFYKVYHSLNTFFTTVLSATYLDILKDRLYTGKKDGHARRSSQSVIYHMLDSLVVIMSPILSFLAEEVYQYIPRQNKLESVYLNNYPKTRAEWENETLKEDFAYLLEIRSDVSQALETLRQDKAIGSSLDAQVTITASGKKFDILKKYESILKELFIVSGVAFRSGEYKITGERAEGDKCVRCWHYSTKLGTHSQFPEVCPKCVEALI